MVVGLHLPVCLHIAPLLPALRLCTSSTLAGYDSRNGGRIVVVGRGSSSTFVYEIRTNAWSTATTRPFAGSHHSAVVIGSTHPASALLHALPSPRLRTVCVLIRRTICLHTLKGQVD